MKGTVGFRSFATLFNPELIKRDALMFRRIGVVGCNNSRRLENPSSDNPLRDVPWLIEQGIIFDPEPDLHHILDLKYFLFSLDEDTRKAISDSNDIFDKYIGDRDRLLNFYLEHPSLQGLKMTKEKLAELIEAYLDTLYSGETWLRPLSVYYRNAKQVDAYPIIVGMLPELPQQSAGVEDIIHIAINHLPIPDDSTSWEQILDFRNDPDTESKFLGFRVWMNEIARAKLTPIEVEQKLEYLLDEYKKHMQLHRMKTNASALETILVSLGDRKFGDIVKGLFSVRHKQIALLEGELKSPGREIAFISKAQETFR